MLEGVPSSPDGFSSDSMMDDDHDMSDGMSSVSDLEGRIHLDFPENVAPDNDFLSAEYPLRRSLSLKVSRGGKRSNTFFYFVYLLFNVNYQKLKSLVFNLLVPRRFRPHLNVKPHEVFKPSK